MARAKKPVLLIGGVPGNSPAEVFRICAKELGDLPIGLTDGETNLRRYWVLFVAVRALENHPDIETVRKPRGVAGMPRYVPAGYDDLYKFTVAQGKDHVQIDTLTYPVEAKASYLTFRRLRDQGVIARDTRFQFCIPFPEDVTRLFTDNVRDMDILSAAYQDAALRDIASILEDIPAGDLVLQWDINWETLAVEANDYVGEEPLHFKGTGDPFDRYVAFIRKLCAPIPKETLVGLHLCYGDLHHRHFLECKTLDTCVRLANAGVKEAGRKINYVHMPVPLARDDDDYFKPLTGLNIGDTTVYIGLVHYTDGVPGSFKRLNTFKKYFSGNAGVATECGLGRRPPDQSLPELLRMHREVAAAL